MVDFTFLFCTCILVYLGACELVVQRLSGRDPDRFTENEGCTTQTCSQIYNSSYLVPGSCQCLCPVERPTFTFQQRTCVKSLHGCEDLILTDRDEAQTGIFTILLSNNLQITPKLPIKDQSTGESLIQTMRCTSPIIGYIERESAVGLFSILELSSLTLITDRDNSTFLQFQSDHSTNLSAKDLSGSLLKIHLKCSSADITYCLPLKIHGFQKAASYSRTTSRTDSSSTQKLTHKLPNNLPYIIGGSALGLLIIVLVTIAGVVACLPAKKPEATVGTLRVKRVRRNPSINSTRKHPIAKVVRSSSVADFRRSKPIVDENRKYSVTRTASLRSYITEDSGRGQSTSPTMSAGFAFDNKALTDAVIGLEAAQSRPSQEVFLQPKLFKTHHEQLSTAREGINSVPAQTHKKQTSPKGKKLSAFRRLFSRKQMQSSQASGSMLSLDYDQFTINDAGPSSAGKRFSESHINPGISFNTEGRLAQTEEVHIELPSARMNGNFKGHHSSNGPASLYSSTGLPVTSIDDVSEEIIDFESYEQVSSSESIDDFVAI